MEKHSYDEWRRRDEKLLALITGIREEARKRDKEWTNIGVTLKPIDYSQLGGGIRLPAYFLDGEWTELPPGEEVPPEIKARILLRLWRDGYVAAVSLPQKWPTTMNGATDIYRVIDVFEENGMVVLLNLNQKEAEPITVEISTVGSISRVVIP
ncbi:hypothetical protein L6279_04860 [Candidatus Parcubacteria bacterium]|nr:hypothetical protein [Patescibacteria group bacterium]MCG2693394.1 hypothetical protein [Candidatus Parcubacteria bacterium]